MFSATCNSCLYVFTPFTFILNYSLMFVFLVLLKTVVSGRLGTTSRYMSSTTWSTAWNNIWFSTNVSWKIMNKSDEWYPWYCTNPFSSTDNCILCFHISGGAIGTMLGSDIAYVCMMNPRNVAGRHREKEKEQEMYIKAWIIFTFNSIIILMSPEWS